MTTELAERPLPSSLGGHSALHVACQGGHIECVRLLLECMNVAVDPKTEGDSTTPLIIALYMAAHSLEARHLQCVQLLLKAGASLGARDAKGRSALDMAPPEWRSALLAYRYAQNGRGTGSCGENALLVALGRALPLDSAQNARRGVAECGSVPHGGARTSAARTPDRHARFGGTSTESGEAKGGVALLCDSLHSCMSWG